MTRTLKRKSVINRSCKACVVSAVNLCKKYKELLRKNFFKPADTVAKRPKLTEIQDSMFGKFNIVKTSSEGNCFYDAVSKSDAIPVRDEKECRDFVFKTAREKEELFFKVYQMRRKEVGVDATISEFRDFIAKHEVDKVWADTMCIYFTAVAFGVDVVSMVQLQNKKTSGHHLVVRPSVCFSNHVREWQPEILEQCFIYHVDYNHWLGLKAADKV